MAFLVSLDPKSFQKLQGPNQAPTTHLKAQSHGPSTPNLELHQFFAVLPVKGFYRIFEAHFALR